MRNKFEQLIEYIINEDTEKANELFHNVVVEKSREIYNQLVAEEMEDEELEEAGMSMDATDDMMGDISADEEGMDQDNGMSDMGDDMDDMGDDMDSEEGEGDLADRVVDLEDALDDLKAEFERLMGDDGGDEYEKPQEGVMREYVEKVSTPGNTEGQGVGAGSIGGSTNTKSTVSSKNDMGGTAKNIAQGGMESAPEGSAYKKPSNAYSKGEGKLPGSGSFENVPGASAGKTFSNAKKPVSSEPSGVNKTSINLK